MLIGVDRAFSNRGERGRFPRGARSRPKEGTFHGFICWALSLCGCGPTGHHSPLYAMKRCRLPPQPQVREESTRPDSNDRSRGSAPASSPECSATAGTEAGATDRVCKRGSPRCPSSGLSRPCESGGAVHFPPAVEAVDRAALYNEGEQWAGPTRRAESALFTLLRPSPELTRSSTVGFSQQPANPVRPLSPKASVRLRLDHQAGTRGLGRR